MSRTLTLDAVEAATDCLSIRGASDLQAAAVARPNRGAEAEGTRGIGLGYLPGHCGHLRVGTIAGKAAPVVRQPASGTVLVDACDGFSHPAFEAGEVALGAAACRQGTVIMGISNAYACGVLGDFTTRLVRQGLVALSSLARSGACWPTWPPIRVSALPATVVLPSGAGQKPQELSWRMISWPNGAHWGRF